jgi:hypothetical protein
MRIALPGAVVLGSLLVAASPASANPRKEGFLFGFAAGGGVVHHTDTGAAVGAHLRAGGIFGDARRFGVLLDGVGTQSWHDGGKRSHGAGTLGVGFWPQKRLSLSLGAGYAAADSGSDEFVGSGPAVIGTVGIDLHQARSGAIVARIILAAADGDDGTATVAALTIGVDNFGMSGSP